MSKVQLYCKHKSNQDMKKKSIYKKIMIFIVVFSFIFNPFIDNVKVARAATQVGATVDYTDETITVAAGSGVSTKFYMSTDEKKTWEVITAGKIDISALLSTKEVNVNFKGNKDTEVTNVKLQAEDRSFAPTYKVILGAGRIEFSPTLAVQYRKGVNGPWITATSPLLTAMYETKGASLYFRTIPTTTVRAGKVVTVKIPKKPTAPSVKLDGSKLCITGLKNGETKYRVGDSLDWITFKTDTKLNYLDLYSLVKASYTENANLLPNTAMPASVIEFYTSGSDKKVDSAVKVIEIPLQVTLASTAASLTLSTLTINDIDTSKAYEYTTLDVTSAFKLTNQRWTTVSSKKAVIVPKVAVGYKVIVRIKSTTDKATKQIIPASTYISFDVKGITPV